MKPALHFCALSAAFWLSTFLCGCGGRAIQTTPATIQSQPAPVLSSITPGSAAAGALGSVLTATGSNFVAGSEITWGGTERPTLYVSTTTLQMNLATSDLAVQGTVEVGVTNPADAGGAASNRVSFLISPAMQPNPVPVLTSITPSSVLSGAGTTMISLSGSNLVPTSAVTWNGQTITSSFVNSGAMSASIPAADLQAGGTFQIAVVNPSPGGGTSNSLPFLVNVAGAGNQQIISVRANDLAWDSVNQVIYLSLPSSAGSNGNSIQVLDPANGALGVMSFAGSEPNLLAVSPASKYLYASLDGSSSVQRFVLPGLTPDIDISFGPASFYGSYVAMDLQASPASDGTVAFVLGTPGTSPAEEGGVLIYDNSVERPNSLCGWIELSCPGIPSSGGQLYDSIQWNTDASEMYALDNEDTGFNFYEIPVNAKGFGTFTSYGALAGGFGDMIHYDETTKLLYTNYGIIIDPSTGTKAGEFGASGLAAPDGKNGVIYFIGQLSGSTGGTTYSIESFDINHYTPIATMTIDNVIGVPTHFIRWGSNGLAFTTQNQTAATPTSGAVYLVSGSFVSAAFQPSAMPKENVQRTWKPFNGINVPKPK